VLIFSTHRRLVQHAHPRHRRRDAAHARTSWSCCPTSGTATRRLWRDKLGQISLATTTLFWGVSGNLRYIVLAWSAAALGYSTTQASSLAAWWPSAPPWAPSLASMRMRLDQATSVMPLGIAMGCW
jgi:LPLT family lysophospholipid transporter-like MFS transporter